MTKLQIRTVAYFIGLKLSELAGLAVFLRVSWFVGHWVVLTFVLPSDPSRDSAFLQMLIGVMIILLCGVALFGLRELIEDNWKRAKRLAGDKSSNEVTP